MWSAANRSTTRLNNHRRVDAPFAPLFPRAFSLGRTTAVRTNTFASQDREFACCAASPSPTNPLRPSPRALPRPPSPQQPHPGRPSLPLTTSAPLRPRPPFAGHAPIERITTTRASFRFAYVARVVSILARLHRTQGPVKLHCRLEMTSPRIPWVRLKPNLTQITPADPGRTFGHLRITPRLPLPSFGFARIVVRRPGR